MSSPTAFSFLQADGHFSNTDYEQLKTDPKRLISILLSRKNSRKFLSLLEKASLFHPKRKSSKTRSINEQLSKLNLTELLKRFADKKATSQSLRKVLGKKLIHYENVGYFYREELWLQASDARFLMQSNKGYYEALKTHFEQSASPFINLIEIDLARTSEQLSPELERMEKCRNVLTCYAKRNPDIGYCQGLNFIVWELSRHHFTEEETFWFFTTLLENILPIDYYSSMVGVLIDQRIFNDLIEEHLPKVGAKFRDLGFDTSLFSIQWFVCVFCRNLNSSLLEVVFDNLVVKGSTIFFKAGLAILKILEQELLKAKDFPALLRIIEKRSKEICDELYFQQKLNEIHINGKVLEMARHFYRQNIEEKQFTVMKDTKSSRRFRSLNQVHHKKVHETKTTCDPQSLVCRTLIEYNQTFRTNYSSFVFRQNTSLVFIIQDYFHSSFTEQNRRSILEIVNNPNFNEDFIIHGLLVGRHHHICKEPVENSPFSPFSPFTPVDFTQIHTFNDTFNEYNQQEKNQSFLKGYLRKSVMETRKSLPIVDEKKIATPPTQQRRVLNHGKTIDIPENKPKRETSIELNSGTLHLKLSLPGFEGEVEDHIYNNSSEFASPFLSLNDVVLEKKNKRPNLKKKEEKKKNDDESDHEEKENRIEARTSMLILQAKGVYKNLKEETVDKYIREIESSDCINFTHEFFIERSKV